MNTAFVFAKPHANTPAVLDVIKTKFGEKAINIVQEGDVSGEEIDSKGFIDQHYYAIAEKSTLTSGKDLPVDAAKFEGTFGETWETVVAEGRAFNALEFSKNFAQFQEAGALDAAWDATSVDNKTRVKLGGGFYCGQIEVEGVKNYTFNAFFMTMRGKFTAAGTSIHYYVVEFDPTKLSWADFRGSVLGPTDPKDAPADALRGIIAAGWEGLGLKAPCNGGDNAVHASASPFEGLAERMNWLARVRVTVRVIGLGLGLDPNPNPNPNPNPYPNPDPVPNRNRNPNPDPNPGWPSPRRAMSSARCCSRRASPRRPSRSGRATRRSRTTRRPRRRQARQRAQSAPLGSAPARLLGSSLGRAWRRWAARAARLLWGRAPGGRERHSQLTPS